MKPTKTLDEVRKPDDPKKLDALLDEVRECVKVVEPLLPGSKLTLRRELVLVLCTAVLELAKPCEHESAGDMLASLEDEGIVDGEATQWRVSPDGESELGEMHLCRRCGCVYWVPTI